MTDEDGLPEPLHIYTEPDMTKPLDRACEEIGKLLENLIPEKVGHILILFDDPNELSDGDQARIGITMSVPPPSGLFIMDLARKGIMKTAGEQIAMASLEATNSAIFTFLGEADDDETEN